MSAYLICCPVVHALMKLYRVSKKFQTLVLITKLLIKLKTKMPFSMSTESERTLFKTFCLFLTSFKFLNVLDSQHSKPNLQKENYMQYI